MVDQKVMKCHSLQETNVRQILNPEARSFYRVKDNKRGQVESRARSGHHQALLSPVDPHRLLPKSASATQETNQMKNIRRECPKAPLLVS